MTKVTKCSLCDNLLRLAHVLPFPFVLCPDYRTKLESIGLLSAMAYCSPAQLSVCLPMIVPRLLEVMTDPNAKVSSRFKYCIG